MTAYGGAVAACGLAGGMDLPATVAPFILRGVSLLGINSVMAPKPLRLEAWRRLATDLDLGKLAAMTTTIGFERVIDAARISSTARCAAGWWWRWGRAAFPLPASGERRGSIPSRPLLLVLREGRQPLDHPSLLGDLAGGEVHEGADAGAIGAGPDG